MANPLGTRRPFTVAVCTRCGEEPDAELLRSLGETIRRCSYGVLALTQCLLGEITCATSHIAGTTLLLQPCGIDRVPLTAAIWVGPVNKSDTTTVCEWIAAGIWDPTDLPSRLRADIHLDRSGLRN